MLNAKKDMHTDIWTEKKEMVLKLELKLELEESWKRNMICNLWFFSDHFFPVRYVGNQHDIPLNINFTDPCKMQLIFSQDKIKIDRFVNYKQTMKNLQ
jgi:hypothetical protein